MIASGNNSGPGASPASQPDGQESRPSRSSKLTSQVISTSAARFEDIIAAVPVTSTPVNRTTKSVVSADFGRRIQTLCVESTSLEQLQYAVASALVHSAGCSYVGWYQAAGSQIGQTATLKALTENDPGAVVQQQLHETALAAVKQEATASARDTQFFAATPVDASNAHCLVIAHPQTGSGNTAILTALELAASRIGHWQTQQSLQQAASDSQNVAALVELISLVVSHNTRKASAQRLVDELQTHLNATEVLFGRCGDQRRNCHLAAISDVPEVDRFSETTRHAEALMQESLARSAVAIWPQTDSGNRHALLSHRQFAEEKRATAVVSCPLMDESGVIVGSLVALFGDGTSADGSQDSLEQAESALRFLNAGSRCIGTAVQVVHRSTTGQFSRWRAGVGRILTGNKGLVTLAIASMAALVLLIPADYRVHCDLELQPVERRYVATPFDAPLEECFVEPGDVVEADQVLARLDGRELRWELAGVRADIAKARKEHNRHLSGQEFGEAAIARHEIDRLKNHSALLTDRDHHLEIRSPVAGVVVSGDLKDREGVPLETGQSLFEIAPLDSLVVEVAIPEEDIRHVATGMSLKLQLDSMPSEIVDATVLRIHPKAELRNHENVFIAEAELQNADQFLRPGMKGTAKISTGRHTLGWNLFHKPVAHLLGWLGW